MSQAKTIKNPQVDADFAFFLHRALGSLPGWPTRRPPDDLVPILLDVWRAAAYAYSPKLSPIDSFAKDGNAILGCNIDNPSKMVLARWDHDALEFVPARRPDSAGLSTIITHYVDLPWMTRIRLWQVDDDEVWIGSGSAEDIFNAVISEYGTDDGRDIDDVQPLDESDMDRTMIVDEALSERVGFREKFASETDDGVFSPRPFCVNMG